MVLSRVGSVLLVLLSLLSFGLVYLLNAGDGESKSTFFSALASQVLVADAAAARLGVPDVIDHGALAQTGGVRRSVFAREEERDGVIRRTLSIGRGETITSRLLMAGITRTEISAALESLRRHVDPRKARGGQDVIVLFTKDQGAERFSGLELRGDPGELVTVARAEGDVFQSAVKLVEPVKQRVALRGSVDDNLYDSGAKLGVPSSVLATIIKTFSHTIDFQRDVKSGDHFEVLFERTEGKDDATLIYAALEVDGRVMPIYRVAMPSGGFEYFDAKGESVRKGLLRTPVEGARLTSGFGMRHHPIMGYSRMHEGVDFGAPSGTPIFAAGAGIVEEAGVQSGYGRCIRIRHSGKLSTAYAHMSHFARGITRGTRVSQGDVIGYVGSTGVSTGPHLHYEVLVDNRKVNPLSVDVPTSISLSGRQLVAFQDWRNSVHSQFEQLMAANVAEEATKLASRSQISSVSNR